MSRGKWTDEQREAARLKRAKKSVSLPSKQEDDKVAQLSEKVDKLFDVVERVVQMVSEKPQPSQPAQRQPDLPEDVSLDMMVPTKWRQMIDKYLGKDFQAEVQEGGNASFSLKIYIPKHLDRRVGPKDDPNPDVSMASPIRRASDVADVEMWCKKIAENIKKTHPNFEVV